MFLFSETFFPLSNLPLWARILSLFSPLTHLVQSSRAFSFGMINLRLILNFMYLFIFCLIFFPLALYKMRKRLIK
jgi:lipooligosaccharide transport system permease protein